MNFDATSHFGVHDGSGTPIDAKNHGVMLLNRHVRIEHIPDGTPNTFSLGEAKVDLSLSGWASGTRSSLRNCGPTINGVLPTPWPISPSPTARSGQSG